MPSCSQRGPGPAYARATAIGYHGHDVTLRRGPAYSMGLRWKDFKRGVTPGPYKINDVTNYGKYPYVGITIGVKPASKAVAATAGPADYFPQMKPRPGYSLGLRWVNFRMVATPGPADYYRPEARTGGISMGLKTPAFRPAVTPGPYSSIDLNKIKSKPPSACIAGKGSQRSAITPGPGPAIHLPKEPKGPAYSFGLKHHECAPPLITAADNNY